MLFSHHSNHLQTSAAAASPSCGRGPWFPARKHPQLSIFMVKPSEKGVFSLTHKRAVQTELYLEENISNSQGLFLNRSTNVSTF